MSDKNTTITWVYHKGVIIDIIKRIISDYNLQFLTDKLCTGPSR